MPRGGAHFSSEELAQVLSHYDIGVIHQVTPLTAGNRFSMPGLITPAQAAQAILKGWAQGRFEIHFPKRFTWWMKALRVMPNRWYFFLVRKAVL